MRAPSEAAPLSRTGGLAVPRRLGVAGVSLAAGATLVGLYVLVVTLAQDWPHARDLLRDDLWFVGPIAVGFGLQIGLIVQLRSLQTSFGPGTAAMTAGSTGMSSGAMLACCAHHVTDIIPLVGASGAAILLNEVKTPLAVAGVAMSWAGVAYLLLKVRRALSRSRC